MTAAVYQPQGAFDIENATRLLAEGAKRIGQNRVLTIDCAGLRACDSAAVATLLEWRQIGAQAGCELSFTNLPDRARQLARLYGVEALIDSAPSP